MELVRILLAAALALLAAFPPVTAGPETDQAVLFQNCSSDRYVEGSNLGRNVKLVVEALAKNAPSTGFNTSSHGSDGDRVYGLIQCRGDLRRSECARCASLISSRVLQSCRNSASALIQLQGCFLRYGTQDFFSEGAEGLKLLCRAGNGSDGPPKGFAEAVQKLLYDVSIRAADNKGFSVQSAGLPGLKIYGLAQCWGDLSRRACGSCLTFASSCAARCRNAAPGAQYLTDSCFVRFDTATFYNTNYTSAPRVEKKARRRGLILIILAAIIGTALAVLCIAAIIGTALAVLCRILCRWARKPNIPETQKYSGILVK